MMILAALWNAAPAVAPRNKAGANVPPTKLLPEHTAVTIALIEWVSEWVGEHANGLKIAHKMWMYWSRQEQEDKGFHLDNNACQREIYG